MRIKRKFTEAGKSTYDAIPFRESASEIRNPDGSVVFSLERFQVPAHWSGVAADILAQKYFRKAGVPLKAKRVEENTLPCWLWRSIPDEEALAALPENERFGSETDAREVGIPAGTQLEVRDLFFNTPARAKFGKSEATETANVSEAMQDAGLVRSVTLIAPGLLASMSSTSARSTLFPPKRVV